LIDDGRLFGVAHIFLPLQSVREHSDNKPNPRIPFSVPFHFLYRGVRQILVAERATTEISPG
jgi:hypothetical protein